MSPNKLADIVETFIKDTGGEEVKEEYIIKEKSLNIEDGNVQVEIVNRQNPEDTHLVSIPLEDSFSMKQIEETAKLQASRVKGGGVQALENINKVMSVYGIVAGFIGAGKFFAENDTARGAFTLSQSLHGVGEMTGLNQQLTRLSRDILHKGLTTAAGELGMEKTLAKVTSSVERFGESTAGQFLKDIPFVGLAFQGYFIAEDSIAIQKSNRSDPEQNKYLGLKVSNLVLDVSTTVLTIAEVAFPPAAIILEPIIIGLTIARMAIGDFYCDVVSELDHLPKGASDFDKMIAVIVGLEEGAVDFVTGGLLREMNALEEEQKQNRELLHNLTTPEFYFTVMASDGNVSTLNLLDGPMSQYGGFVTVRMLDDGHVKIQIGGVPDGEGGVKTIHKSLYNPSIQNIVLGVGESSKFLYTEKAAHLWWVIPVHHAKVICGEIKLHSSLFGNYYGNDKANQFIAPQLPENKQPLPSKDPCAYGRQDLDFVIRNYHYTIYGHGGDDIFFMGPQSSKLSGGEGKDFYIFPTAGSYAEIDNFANDEFEDQMLIKAPFGNIDCIRKDADLLLVYGPQRYTVTVRNWFAHSNIDHYQHMSFQSADGVRFKVEDRGLVGHRFHANCIPETLDKTKSASAVSIRLVGEFNSVTTVVGSKFSDRIVGNEKNNVFNGGPGMDLLEGGEGADTYEIFQGEGCDKINNFAQDQKLDLVVFQVPFRRIQADLHGDDLLVFDKKDPSLTCVHLTEWNTNSLFQHVAFLSSDHVTFHIALNNSRLEITAIMVDLSKESHGSTINLSGPHQQLSVISVFDSPYNDNISGNALGNFLSCSGGRDFLKGAGGSDKYVIKSGCKGAVISNYAEDQASDVLFLEHPFENLRVKYRYSDLILTVEDLDIEVRLVKWLKVLYKDIEVLLEHPHVILFSRSRNDSVRVRLLKYLEGPEHQHLLIRTSDGVSFWVNPNSYPYKSVISIDTSTSTKSCNISCAEGEEYLKVSSIHGATGFSNYITGSRSSNVINGGNMADYIQGNEGNERIEGHGGNDIMNGRGGDDVLLGGKGDDDITGGEGNDIIYGGWGADRIDGGPGIDTVFFSGDVRTSTGVKVDLSSGRGEWADAQNDTYEDVESVSGTNFNDLLIGDDEDNELAGKFGNDTLMPGHGTDFLFGGPGNDVYILDDCSGVKYINNFASDMALDYLLLRDFHPKDACFFLQEGTLVISFSHHNRLLKLIQEDSLTVLLENWSYNGSFYQHMDFVFAENALVSDTYFSSAIDISPTLQEINSSSPALHVMQANETSVDIEVKAPHVAESTETTWGSKLQYQIKVSDQLFFSDSLQWTNQSVITYSGLLSGVLYSFQLSVTICEYVEVTYHDMRVQCAMFNLESSGNEYVGIAEGNPNREGWGRICIEDYSAATSFCRKLFPDQEWTVSVLDGSWFSTSYTYRCNRGCRFHTDSKWCSKQIRCRATCDPYPISNGQVSCSSTLEGELCSVSCNRLYRLQGDSWIQCRSNGWSSDPYCIETGECGYYYETGPHSTGCLTKLWTEAGCNVKADLSPTKPGNRDFWNRFEDDTVSEVRRYMGSLVDPGPFTYNHNCQTDDECFPGRSMVLTHEGNRKSMSELRLGDRVLALGADGHLTFSEVILWLDRRPTARERYILLSTEGSSDPLALSADHVTFIAPSNTTAATAGTMVPVFAKDLQRGHLLYRHHSASGSLKASRVTNVQETVELGAFAPMTVEGNLVVDEHLVSCYALQCRQYMAHLPFAPYRLLNSLRSYVPLFSRLFPPQTKLEGEGIHWYARAWHQVGQWFGYPFGKTCYPNELTQYHYP
ncbi:hypothetical protein AGOR_G00033050 [Albula goreensis]|uniref:Sushi domain-containing protein n=1 Tax=Albula goreensis TaxID=1534307 RepID=A0A8T3DZF6_9TELE|nr:hypothetical protein AGOR_G00033050 [Albula goreensis]